MEEKTKIITAIPNKPLRATELEINTLVSWDPKIKHYIDGDRKRIVFEVPEYLYHDFKRMLQWRGWAVDDNFTSLKEARNSQLTQIENSLKTIKDNAEQALKTIIELNTQSEQNAEAPSIYKVINDISNFLDVIELELDKIWKTQ